MARLRFPFLVCRSQIKRYHKKTLYPYKKTNSSEFAIPTTFIGSTKAESATRHTLTQHPQNWSAHFVCTPFTLEVKPVSLALTLRALAQLVGGHFFKGNRAKPSLRSQNFRACGGLSQTVLFSSTIAQLRHFYC